jgi:hypothetical protein
MAGRPWHLAWARRRGSALLDLDVQPGRRLRDLAGDRLGLLLGSRAERVGLLGAVPAWASSLSRRPAAKSCSEVRLCSVCLACWGSASATSGSTPS